MAKEVVDNAESILTSKRSSSSQLLHITEISLVYVQICWLIVFNLAGM